VIYVSDSDDERLADWFEHANNGEGPTIIAQISRVDFDAIADAVEERNQAQRKLDAAVAVARERGAAWSMIGDAMGITKQGAFSRYAHAHAIASA